MLGTQHFTLDPSHGAYSTFLDPPVCCNYSFSFSSLTQFHPSLKNFIHLCPTVCDNLNNLYASLWLLSLGAILVLEPVHIGLLDWIVVVCASVMQLQTPCCCCGCSVLSFILLFHFSTKFCSHFQWCDEAGYNMHSSNANFDFQYLLNAIGAIYFISQSALHWFRLIKWL